ncbi:MAG TPA: response regulator [Methylomirabilota bacterium]|nr:response regulator [Methylomirabilota bacterium]
MREERKKKILIVEDNDSVRKTLALALSYMDHEPIEAKTGCEAVKKSVTENPALVLTEISLPGMNGIEAVRRIKQNPQTAAIPVVCYTVWKERALRKIAFEAGISEYLVKPVSIQVLKRTIQKLTENLRKGN